MTQDVLRHGGSLEEDINGSDGQSSMSESRQDIGESQSRKAKKRTPSVKPIAKACNLCAKKKARCPGGLPCAPCTKAGAICEYAPAQRRGPKVKKRATVQTDNIPVSGQSEEEGLNLLANLSRVPDVQGNSAARQAQDINVQNELLSLNSTGSIVRHDGASQGRELPTTVVPPPAPQPTRLPSFTQDSTHDNDNLTISPGQVLLSLPVIHASDGHPPVISTMRSSVGTSMPSAVGNESTGRQHSDAQALSNETAAESIFKSLNLPYRQSQDSAQCFDRYQQAGVEPSFQPNGNGVMGYESIPAKQLQHHPSSYHQQSQHYQGLPLPRSDGYVPYLGQFAASYAGPPQPFSSSENTSASSYVMSQAQQVASHSHLSSGYAKSRSNRHDQLPSRAEVHAESPSGSESAFAQSFYKAAGPGLDHFQTVLSREFNVQESPAAGPTAAGTTSSHGQDPSTVLSEIGFSPAGSDIVLPAHMERDLIALADLTSTQQTLFGLYWCFVHVQWPIVYRPAFGFEQAKESPALFNAMLSVTCRHDVSRQLQHVPGTLKNLPLTSRLGEIYTKRAIAFLDMHEMQSSLHKVQALFMLALRDVAQGATSRGWMFSGMATRMAFDLQLHQPSKMYKPTNATQIVQQQHRRTIWCCYALDKSMSLFLGRPAMMKSNDIETPLPSHWEADEFSYWAEDAKAVIPDRLDQFIGIQARPISTVLAYIKLCQIIERIMGTIYKPKAGPARSSSSTAVELNDALDEWQEEHAEIFKRAESLANSTTNLYHLLLWYYTTRLILNRPFIPSNQIMSVAKGNKSAYDFCTEAADNVVAVVTSLEQTHGIFRCSYNVLFTIFQAGVMHCLVSSTAKDPLVCAKANESLKQCDAWLESMTETYKCGAQYRHVLGAMERLSRRELRDSVQLTEILASRRGSRQTTPAFEVPPGDNGLLPNDFNDNPLSGLHYSFWDMPLHFPLQNNEMDSWMSWEQDYGSLLLDGINEDGI